MYCTACGRQLSPGAHFCSQCGAPTAETASATQMTGGELRREPGPPPTSAVSSTETVAFHRPASIERLDTNLSHADAEAVAALPRGSALLVVLRGPGVGSRYLLDSDVQTVGRQADSDIFLDDVTVSRRHAKILRDEATFTVQDVGSLNGIYLNRDRVDTAQLNHHDELQVGKYRLVFFNSNAR